MDLAVIAQGVLLLALGSVLGSAGTIVAGWCQTRAIAAIAAPNSNATSESGIEKLMAASVSVVSELAEQEGPGELHAVQPNCRHPDLSE